MAKTERKERSQALYETILKLKDLDECRKFFEDLCTPTELQSMEQRFDVAVYLQQGLVYLDILEKTGPAALPSAGSAGPCWKAAQAVWYGTSSSGKAWTKKTESGRKQGRL